LWFVNLICDIQWGRFWDFWDFYIFMFVRLSDLLTFNMLENWFWNGSMRFVQIFPIFLIEKERQKYVKNVTQNWLFTFFFANINFCVKKKTFSIVIWARISLYQWQTKIEQMANYCSSFHAFEFTLIWLYKVIQLLILNV
jgi:hypothetical protein